MSCPATRTLIRLTDCIRLVLYYPVSALVTLFANILQNPQDARARSDLKLMSSVVAFLTMLERDITEANSNVRRMLSICAEFERIAKVVLDKAERDLRGRGKRKAAGLGAPTERERERAQRSRAPAEVEMERNLDEGKTLEQMQIETQAPYRRPVQTPSLRASVAGSQGGSPASWGNSPSGSNGPEYRSPPAAPQNPEPYQQQQVRQSNAAGPWNYPAGFPMNDNYSTSPHQQQQPQQQQQPMSAFQPSMQPGTDYSATSFPLPGQGLIDPLSGGPGGSGAFNAGPGSAFQQPFVPQDLWQMPMTLEWDWAEGLGLGSFTPGPTTLFDGFGPDGGMGMGGGAGMNNGGQ